MFHIYQWLGAQNTIWKKIATENNVDCACYLNLARRIFVQQHRYLSSAAIIAAIGTGAALVHAGSSGTKTWCEMLIQHSI